MNRDFISKELFPPVYAQFCDQHRINDYEINMYLRGRPTDEHCRECGTKLQVIRLYA